MAWGKQQADLWGGSLLGAGKEGKLLMVHRTSCMQVQKAPATFDLTR
jgi:hypothetical protein